MTLYLFLCYNYGLLLLQREDAARHEVGGEGDEAAAGDDAELGEGGQDGQPDADVLGALGHGAPHLRERLEGVEADFEGVGEEGHQWGERERHDEQ